MSQRCWQISRLLMAHPLGQHFSPFPITSTNIWLALLGTPSIRGNVRHTYGFSTLLYYTPKALLLSDYCPSDTLMQSSLTYEFQKDIQLDLGLLHSQTNHGSCLSGCIPRDWKLGCLTSLREPGHPPLIFTINGSRTHYLPACPWKHRCPSNSQK